MARLFHSLLRIPIRGKYQELPTSAVGTVENRLRNCQYLIIDEKSMVSLKLLNWVDHRLQQVKHSPLPYGGISILLFGDFYQLPPVIEHPLFYHSLTKPLRDYEDIGGKNAYNSLTVSCELTAIM